MRVFIIIISEYHAAVSFLSRARWECPVKPAAIGQLCITCADCMLSLVESRWARCSDQRCRLRLISVDSYTGWPQRASQSIPVNDARDFLVKYECKRRIRML